jgi:hypothetical protein
VSLPHGPEATIPVIRQSALPFEEFIMAPAPYNETFCQRGDLCFRADIPALAHIGARFDEITDGWMEASAPPEELEQWRRLCSRLEELTAAAGHGEVKSWRKVETGLERDFGDYFAQARHHVMRPIHEYFESGQMPLAEYVEWHLQGAETMWMRNAGPGQGPDSATYQGRLDRLTARLRDGGYETQQDREMREEDPARYAFLAKSAALAMDAISNPDPNAMQDMFTQQLEMYRMSPLFTQGKEMLERMRQQAEQYRDSDPELYQEQLESVAQMQRMMEDPAAAIKEMQSQLDMGEDEEGDEDATPTQEQPPGRLTFNCGRAKKPSRGQIALFQQFVTQQEQLRPEIERALREMHAVMAPDGPMMHPGDRLMFPPNADETDVPLQCFSITQVNLDDQNGRVVIALDTQFGHYDEHGCFIAVRDGAVESYGTWDEVYGGDDYDDEDDDDFGDEEGDWDDDDDE